MAKPIQHLVLAAGMLATAYPALAASTEAAPVPAPPAAANAPAAQETAPPAAPAVKPTREEEIESLKKAVEQLQKRLDELEKEKAKEKEMVPEPPPAPPPPPPTAGTGGGGATFLPNISIVGNLIARGGDTRAFPGRGRTHLDELEVAFQDAVAPKLRYDVFLSAEKEESWSVGLEEGFLTATGPLKGLNILAGRKRTPLGKFNPLHPHQWLFITQPTSHAALLGDHGLIADGALAHYVLPTKRFYSAFEFGLWQTASIHAHGEHEEEMRGLKSLRRPGSAAVEPIHEEDLGFKGGENGAYSARFHLSKALGRTKELELGASRYWGHGPSPDLGGRRRLAINGLDLSYRSYPGAYQRLWLLAELLAHETGGIGGGTKLRPGGFAMLAYRWNRYWEAGLRADYTQFPYPVEGKEYGGSLFLTKYLTEQTSLRLEYRHERDPAYGASNGIFFQLLFGSGPHTHELQ